MSDISDTDSLELPQTDGPNRIYCWILPGLALFLAAFPLLFWNESKTLDQYRSLEKGMPEVHSVRMDRIDPEMDGKLVHVSGLAITGERLRDPVFGVSANAVKLRRRVQVYQWRERRVPVADENGAEGEKETAVIYEKTWSDAMIPSSEFRAAAEHANPSAPPYATREFTAKTVTLGVFTLSRPFIEQIDRYQPMQLDRDAASRLPLDLRWNAHREPHGFFIGSNPKAPEIGDMKINFQSAGPLTLSVVGRQAGNLLLPYPTDRGVISLLRVGAHSANGMFPQARHRRALLTWGLRLGGFGLMFFGLALMLVPILRKAEAGGPFLKGVADRAGPWLLGFLMASALSFAAIASVWFAARPILAAVLVGTAVLFIIGLWMLPERSAT